LKGNASGTVQDAAVPRVALGRLVTQNKPKRLDYELKILKIRIPISFEKFQPIPCHSFDVRARCSEVSCHTVRLIVSPSSVHVVWLYRKIYVDAQPDPLKRLLCNRTRPWRRQPRQVERCSRQAVHEREERPQSQTPCVVGQCNASRYQSKRP
jgi:hypothetical protein